MSLNGRFLVESRAREGNKFEDLMNKRWMRVSLVYERERKRGERSDERRGGKSEVVSSSIFRSRLGSL